MFGMDAWQADQRSSLDRATDGLDLTPEEERFLDWLSGWEGESITAMCGIVWKARRLADI